MQSSKQQQGEIRKPSPAINAKKQRKTTEGERVEISKIRDTKGIFHAQMATIKHRNGMELIEAEDVKKRWQEYTRRPIQKRNS